MNTFYKSILYMCTMIVIINITKPHQTSNQNKDQIIPNIQPIILKIVSMVSFHTIPNIKPIITRPKNINNAIWKSDIITPL